MTLSTFARGLRVLAAIAFAGCAGAVAEPDQQDKPAYHVRKAEAPPKLDEGWDGASWRAAETLTIAHWYPKDEAHRPKTQAKVLYDAAGLYVMFHVDDRYVRATRTTYQEAVCNDSCVEFFVQPVEGKGYFNFEMNCIGTLLLMYIEDPAPGPDGFAKSEYVPAPIGETVARYTSLKRPIEEEISEPTTWTVAYHVPWELFEEYVGPVREVAGKTWRANFYTCADETSHPRWGAWAPIGEQLNFHQPNRFAPINFTP